MAYIFSSPFAFRVFRGRLKTTDEVLLKYKDEGNIFQILIVTLQCDFKKSLFNYLLKTNFKKALSLK